MDAPGDPLAVDAEGGSDLAGITSAARVERASSVRDSAIVLALRGIKRLPGCQTLLDGAASVVRSTRLEMRLAFDQMQGFGQ